MARLGRKEINETKERGRMEVEARRKERNKRMLKRVKDNTETYEFETPVSQSLFIELEVSQVFLEGELKLVWRGKCCQQVKLMM
jgi:hypothetical protein